MTPSDLTLDFMLDRPKRVEDALKALALSEADERGAVFTRPQVVEFILDLADYTVDRDLATYRLLEPSFGSGEFLFACVRRLLACYSQRTVSYGDDYSALCDAIRAVELHTPSFEKVRDTLLTMLSQAGIDRITSARLADTWLICDDFLLTDLPARFTHVVGNPPYVRHEQIDDVLMIEYRHRYSTMYDRADLYIPFFERGLQLLGPQGTLAFICADRWTKNKYGGPLRKLVSERFHLQYYVDMVHADAFNSEVSAYPGIFVITRNSSGESVISRTRESTSRSLRDLAQAMKSNHGAAVFGIERADFSGLGSQPWMLNSTASVNILRRLEDHFPTLEEDGCTVGIGVATGADKVFIRQCEELPVEQSRRLPLVMSSDIYDGSIEWKGRCVLNPFESSGSLVDLKQYPLFAAYLHQNEEVVRHRHVAKRSGPHWFRTIDRIYEGLTWKPKLLIPDIKGSATIAYDEGKFYPHHNLYFVVSDTWDLRALQTLLRSSVAEFIVSMYCTKMRGGYLRFQAQYLRRIRIPRWNSLTESQRLRLHSASSQDRDHCDAIAFEVYGLSEVEQNTILEHLQLTTTSVR